MGVYMFISGNTKIFALIGNNIAHSPSPEIHNFLIRSFKMNAVYIPLEIKENLSSFFQFFKSTRNFKGCNITIPYKEEAYLLATEAKDNLHKIKSVNTIWKNHNNVIVADNTDIFGFEKSLKEDLCFTPENKNIIILGSGGTARSIIFSLLNNKAKKIIILSRREDSVKDILTEYNNVSWKHFENKQKNLLFPDADIFINATPLGLKGEIIHIDYSSLKKECRIFDVLYIVSPLVKNAEKHGILAISGLNMLLNQAVKSFELWTNFKIDDKLTLQLKKRFRK
jgi:shikimate dehydrogenase